MRAARRTINSARFPQIRWSHKATDGDHLFGAVGGGRDGIGGTLRPERAIAGLRGTYKISIPSRSGFAHRVIWFKPDLVRGVDLVIMRGNSSAASTLATMFQSEQHDGVGAHMGSRELFRP